MSKVMISVVLSEEGKHVKTNVLDGDGEVVESHSINEGGTKFFVKGSQTLSVYESGEEGLEAEPESGENEANENEEEVVVEIVSPVMRAKMLVASVIPHESGEGETLNFSAVSKSDPYDEDGSDENNTYANFTPTANLSMEVVNPALLGKIKVGEAYYLDFTLAEAAQPADGEQE